MKRLLLLLVTAALLSAGTATAATIDDISALGYTVGIANTIGGCTIYSVSGYGISVYLNGCDQAAVDQLANPAAHCNRRWQAEHSDQLAALNGLSRKGYAISGDQCADSYTVTNPKTGTVVYAGAGAGLPSANESNGPAPDPPSGTPAPPSSGPSTCLPLCPTPKPAPVTGTAPTTTAQATSEMEPGLTLDTLLLVTRRVVAAGTAVPV